MQIDDPRELLTPRRFDINAKTLYARQREKQVQCQYHKVLYLEHLRVWNNFFELEPPKSSPEDFTRAFDALLDSVKSQGFVAGSAAVPVRDGSPYNGAHRVAACIVHNKPIRITSDITSGQADCGWKFFHQKRDMVPGGLALQYCDQMALEYCRTKRNVHTISLFAADKVDIAFAEECIARYARPVYERVVELTELGKFNYMANLYANEPWIGSVDNGFAGLQYKTQACFVNSNAVKVYLVECDDLSALNACKQIIREHYGRGNHSIHINDTFAETWLIASSVFNENSRYFLNKARQFQCLNFQRVLGLYRQWLMQSSTDVEDVCVVSSAVLSAFGLRDCRDLDFLSHTAMEHTGADIGCHNKEESYYGVHRDEIIYNPANHFYLGGLKFCTLNVVKVMKWNRREPKDIQDIKLILDFEGVTV